MKENKENSRIGGQPSPSQREQLAEEGQVKRSINADSFDDDYESGQEDEIIREEGRSEKDNLPGKN